MLLHLSIDEKYHQLLVSEACKCVPSLFCLIYPPKGPLRNLEAEPIFSNRGCLLTSKCLEDVPATTVGLEENKTKECSKNSENKSGSVRVWEVNNISSVDGNESTNGERLKHHEVPQRQINMFLDENSIGLIQSRDTRMKIFEILKFLALSEMGRKGLRQLDIYEVFRLWHLLEKDDEIL